MPRQALFAGLVVDEYDHPVEVAYVGDEPCYVVNDAGFMRHIPSEQVDRQVFDTMIEQIEGNEGLFAEQAAKMMGQEDIFSMAMIANQVKQLGQHFDTLLNTGIPEEGRAYMGMLGFKIRIDVHGEVIEFTQPGATGSEGDE